MRKTIRIQYNRQGQEQLAAKSGDAENKMRPIQNNNISIFKERNKPYKKGYSKTHVNHKTNQTYDTPTKYTKQ